MNPPESLYIHVPFCRHRCGYCNFTLVAGRDHLIDSYLRAIEKEVARAPAASIKTIFIGGGTPTHLSIEQLSTLLDIFESKFDLSRCEEFSMEGNPMDFDDELVEFLHSKKVNRISLGVQSFQPGKLKLLERDHSKEVILRAVELIKSKIEDFSIDLIIGTAGETQELWHSDLREAIGCRPKHVSTYSLTVEKGTQFWNREQRDQRLKVDDETSAELYETGVDLLQANGFRHYEVSNFAQPGFECRHNINYWNAKGYFGFGPGAARYVDGIRGLNHQSTSQYIRLVLDDQDPTVEKEFIDAEQSARERLIFGLRQIDGIDVAEFQTDTGQKLEDLVGGSLEELLEAGLLAMVGNHLRLTRSGLLVSDSIWPEFL